MKTFELRLYRDDIAPQSATRVLKAGPVRVLYVVSGALRIIAGDLRATLGDNSALHTTTPIEIAGGARPTALLRWELVSPGAALDTATSSHISSTLLLSAPLALDPSASCLLRCDRVDFPPGGEALTHTHRGGGIRCLLFGGITIHTGGIKHDYAPLEPWFEAGPEPVYAAVSKTGDSAFARVMILPKELLGKSSISYVNPEDLAKPKNQRYQVFVDVPIVLPR